MKQNNYDEYQLLNRYKAAYQTLIFLLAAIFINGFAAEKYMWAPPVVQALILLILASVYFVTVCVFKNAYLSKNIKNNPLNMCIFAILGLLNAGISASALNSLGVLYFIKDGKLQRGIIPAAMGAFFLYITIIMLIKYLIDKKSVSDE